MQISEIEKLIENRTDHHPIDVYIHMLSRGYKLTEIQFISIACRYLNRSPSTRHLVQKWRDDMVFCVSSEELGVCVFYGVKDIEYSIDKYLTIFDWSSLAYAKNVGGYLCHPQNHLELWEHHTDGCFFEYERAPKGEVVYRKHDGSFVLYCDARLIDTANDMIDLFKGSKLEVRIDEQFDRTKM